MDLASVDTGLLLAVLLAISIGGLIKGITGVGLPIFGVPALAAITSVEEAVVLMLFPSISANLWLVVSHRKYAYSLREHLPFLLTGFAGALVGTGLLLVISERGLILLLAIWLGLYLVHYLINNKSLQWYGAGGKTAYALGLAAGTIQGATGISAQIVAPYFHSRGLASETYAFAVAFTFLFFALAQVAAMTNMELLTPARFQLSLLALIPTLIFTQLGISVSRVISHSFFNKILLAIFVLMEMMLIRDLV